MTLIDRILKLAGLWAAARGHTTTSRLSTIVANDGGLLKRLEAGGNATVQTLDRFVHFLRTPANWPTEQLPDEAQSLVDEIGHLSSLPEDGADGDARPFPADERKVA